MRCVAEPDDLQKPDDLPIDVPIDLPIDLPIDVEDMDEPAVVPAGHA